MAKKLIQGVGQTIRLLRVEKKLNQEELADKAGLDRTYVSGVERCVRNITLESLESIVEALDVDVSFFLSKLSENIGKDNNLAKEED